jgi:DNA-directed RNA polymerase specialized sigma24 family protein
LHGFVGRRVVKPEDAEDVVQDVFVRMQRNIGVLSSADGWMLGRFGSPATS